MTIFTLTFALLLDACTAQIHATLPVTCFHCDNHARPFPACLNELVTCHPDEVCSILYGNGLPTLKCQKANDCARDVSHPTRLCTGGGVEVHPNQCELCCPTTECVQGINELLLLEFPRPVQQGPVHCFHCDNHARHFPSCLSEPVTCHADEVCSFVYGNGLPLIGCEKAKDCALDVSRPMRNCAGGGVEVHPNQCELCCSTTACVQEMNGLLLQEFPNHGVFCPGTCSERDIATCIQTAAYCHVDQFCAVGVNEQLVVNGQCRATHDIQKCRDDQAKHPCNLAVGQTGHIAKCVWDCCDTKECLNAHFGAYMGLITTRPTTMAPTTPLPTTSLPVTPAPTTPAPTTPVPTTPAPTTPVPTAPYVTSTAATPDKPLTCAKCDGACKDNEIEVTCPDGFCSLTVDDSSGGVRVIKKGCSDLNKCRIFWTEWNSDPICHRIIENPGQPSYQDVSCSFCCTGERCNADLTHMSVYRRT